MVELKEKANSYAEENVNTVLKEAFAKVYADGYKDGYKDCKDEIQVNLCDGRTEYVDLGLPSGTLWSADFEKDNEKILYFPYKAAQAMNIPTYEQFAELQTLCEWTINKGIIYCIGPNGNSIVFHRDGYKKLVDSRILNNNIWYFWFHGKETEEEEKNVIKILYRDEIKKTFVKMYTGYMLPVRLVKTK